ncbi:thioredoxin [Sphingomonas sp. PP-CE-3G-477]|nr:thioredoxin [Sphingomonas sp. PP-CE-3G-477]
MKVDDASFDSLANRQGLTLFDLWSPGCHPCHTLMPIVEDLAADFANDAAFCKINVEAEILLRDRLGARSLPTLVLYRDGSEIDRLIGLRTRSQLTTWIEAHL